MSCARSKFKAWDTNHEENIRNESKSIVPETGHRKYSGKQSMKDEQEQEEQEQEEDNILL